ncbi:MAG: hypothetical protein V3U24_02730 [Candidatus Neomarinimicrobiota bacterium]
MKKALLLFLLAAQVFPQSGDATLTLYKDGFGLVKQSVEFKVKPGRNAIRYARLPDKIESQSPFLSLPEAEIIYQRFNHNRFDTFGFLANHLGQKVKIKPVHGWWSFKGKLLNIEGKWMTISRWWSTRIVNLDEVVRISIGGKKIIPSVSPELVWEVSTNKKGDLAGDLIYIARGFDWDADYRLVVSPDEKAGKLSTYAIVKNETNLTFSDSRVELVEGELRRISRRTPSRLRMERPIRVEGVTAVEPMVFDHETLGDYHFYTLSEALTVPNNEAITVSLYPERQIEFTRLYRFENRERSSSDEPLTVELSFENVEKNNMGLPLPAGSFQIYYTTDEGNIKFAGEDFLRQVAVGEKASVIAGRAFDVLGNRTVVNYNRMKKSEEATIQVEIKNRRKDRIAVQLREHITGDWVIRESSHDYKKTDAQTVQFDLSLPPGRTERVTYTYRKAWE